jgi:hypothetical protein
MATKKCGAKTRSGNKCNKSAGWGTDHNGTGRCKLHGGASKGAPKGSQNALKHGIYARLFKPEELDAAADMAGTVDTELAIARLQLRNLIEKMQADKFELRKVEVKVLGIEGQDEHEAKLKDKRARDAERCGEYYDPDDDDYGLEQESAPLEIKRTQEKRDWPLEYIRLTKLIESLERTRLSMLEKNAVMVRAAKAAEDPDNLDDLTDDDLDRELCELARGDEEEDAGEANLY